MNAVLNQPHANFNLSTVKQLCGQDGIMTDGDWIESKDQDPDGDVRLIQLADIGDGEFLNRSSRFLTSETADRLGCTYLKAGDVLIARMPDPLGRACILPRLEMPAVAAVDVCIWRQGKNGADPRWLMHAINSPEVRRELEMLAGGTTRQRISGGNLKRFKLLAPPYEAQRRCAAAVDERIARVADCEHDLKRALQLSEKYVSRLIDATISLSGGKVWKIGDIAEVVTGKTPPTKDPDNFGGALPFIKPTDLDSGYHVESARETLSTKGLRFVQKIPANSTLVTCIGATIGKTGYARMDCATNQQINAVIAKEQVVDPRWLYWGVVSESFQAQIFANASATTLPIINKRRFEKLTVSVPSLEVQESVVKTLEEHVRAIDAVTSETKRALELCAHLKRQILDWAYHSGNG